MRFVALVERRNVAVGQYRMRQLPHLVLLMRADEQATEKT